MANYQNFDSFFFSTYDYVVFFLLLFGSTAIGIFFGYFRKKNKPQAAVKSGDVESKDQKAEMDEYLRGARSLSVVPVALSLIASYISAITVLGTPAEIYNYGTQYSIIVVAIIFMMFAVGWVYLPVFSKLRVKSSYHYLNLRFGNAIRSITSVIFILDELLFLPMIVYVPALALNQVTGINTYVIGSIMCAICVLYTLVGGISAAVYTESGQILIMFVSMMVVIVLGTYRADGPIEIFKEASAGGRLIFFKMNPSLYERLTFWSVLIGGFTYWTSFNAVNQTMVQRYLSLATLTSSRWALALFTIGIGIFVALCCYSGILIYMFYRHCDPMSANLIEKDDQLLPIYVMQTLGDLPGVPGLFIGGVFGAAISSLSAVLHATALVFLEDILKGLFNLKIPGAVQFLIVKSVIVVLGCHALIGITMLKKLGSILGVGMALTGIAASTTFGMFNLGMLIPWSNSKGTIIGAIVGFIMATWAALGAQVASANGYLQPYKLGLLVDECPGNATVAEIDHSLEEEVFPLYRLSYLWICPIGIITTVLTGTIASFLTGPTKVKELSADLLSPVIHGFLPQECFEIVVNIEGTPKGE